MKNIKIKKKYVVLAVLTLIVAVGTVSLAYLQGSVINDLINNTKVTTGNVDVKTVSHKLGHASTDTTLKFYVQDLESTDRASAELLENMLISNVSIK